MYYRYCSTNSSCHTVKQFTVYSVQGSTEPEFLNICWRLKSRLFKKSCLFKGQRVQQGSNNFCVLME